MIPYGKQNISADDIAAMVDSINTGWLTTGPAIAEFEGLFANKAGAKHAVAVNNGTSALHAVMMALKIGQGQRVITTPNTFLASANCAAYVGATPDFADIDPVTYNLSVESLEEVWQDDTAAVVAVDYAGQTPDMPSIASFARERGAIVIEDACHAVGGKFSHDGKTWSIGDHPWADVTTYSFHPVKTITTGEGGMIVTDDDDLAQRLRTIRHHGMVRSEEDCVGLGAPDLGEKGPWYYEMPELGHNFRITDFQCALGISQLSKLDSFVARRREIVAEYNEAFADLAHLMRPGVRNEADRALTSWHLYTVQIDFDAIGMTRTQVMSELREKGIGTQVLYIPVHLQPYYRRTYGYKAGKCPVAEEFYRHALSLPLFPLMSDEDVRSVVSAVKLVIG